MLPSEPSPDTDLPAPDAETLLAQANALGLTTLPLLATQTPAAETLPGTHAPTANLPMVEASGTVLLKTQQLVESTPIFGDGGGDLDFAETLDSASENLHAVEGDASSVAARQASLPSPPPSTSVLQDAVEPNAPTLSAFTPSPTSEFGNPLVSEAQPALEREPQSTVNAQSPLRSEPPTTSTPIAPAHTTTPTTLHASNGVEGATPPHAAEPNWGAAEQVAQHIERMVYERERNSLTVRLDPPELGTVEIRIQATGGEVQAWLSAERDLTRQMLQQAQQYLREHLESRGLQLSHFDVGTQSQFHHAPREQRTHSAPLAAHANTPTATDSLLYDGRWSVWV